MHDVALAIDHAGGPAQVASKLGVSPQAVYFWRKGLRSLPVEHCATLEAMCGHYVRRWQLRPADWHRIWPELIDTEGAPPAPADPADLQTSQEAA